VEVRDVTDDVLSYRPRLAAIKAWELDLELVPLEERRHSWPLVVRAHHEAVLLGLFVCIDLALASNEGDGKCRS
jgi:hypothetical protein